MAGHSMMPTLRDGEYLLYASAPISLGSVVVADDPHDPGRWIVKRVLAARDGDVWLAGDDAGHSLGWVKRDRIIGRVFFRYWPLRRVGLVRSR